MIMRKPRRKTPGKTPVRGGRPPKAPQEHGGAIHVGGVPGNAGGSGRPPSVLREACRDNFGERIEVLDAIAGGSVMQRIEVPLATVLEYATCPNCDPEELRRTAGERVIVIEGAVSPSPADRIKAIDVLGKYGLDSRTQLSVEEIRDRLSRQLIAIRENLPPALADKVVGQLRAVWA